MWLVAVAAVDEAPDLVGRCLAQRTGIIGAPRWVERLASQYRGLTKCASRGTAAECFCLLDGLPDRARGCRHSDVANLEPAQGIDHGADHRGRRRRRPSFPAGLDADGVGW